MIEDDPSIERLNGWMFRTNAYATNQRARLMVGLAV